LSGTIAAAAKAALLGRNGVLAGLSGLEGVAVGYDMLRDAPREMVFGGDAEGSVQLSAFKGGGRLKREENLSLVVEIRVHDKGQETTEDTDVRAIEISTVIEEYIAANPKLGDLPNLLKATVDGVKLSSWLDDDGATSSVVLTIGLHSFLS
jgi:hypothetical protein